MAISSFRGAAYGRLPPVFHHSKFSTASTSVPSKLKGRNGVSLFLRYSQTQDFSSRLQAGIDNLPKLVEDIVQTSLNTGPRGAVRLAQGIQAVLGVGGEWLADVTKTANMSKGLPTHMQLGLLSPLYLRRLFERMGATYIKLGQFIASAPTLFPPEYVEEFQKSFDRAPTVPFEEIQAILREDLGRAIDSVYEYVDPVPIASASVAQVHCARLRGTQEDVVIKVLKPGIEDTLVVDLNFIYVVTRILEFKNPDEFYFKMVNTRTVNGVHQPESQANKYTQEELMLMKSQDIGYIQRKVQSEKKGRGQRNKIANLTAGISAYSPRKAASSYRELEERKKRANDLEKLCMDMALKKELQKKGKKRKLREDEIVSPTAKPVYKWRTERKR